MPFLSAEYDLIIAGGGPVGAALALALARSPLSVLLLEARAEPVSADPRPLALSHGSRLILERLGVWQTLSPATAIGSIHVSTRGNFGRSVLTAKDAGVPALGYVVNYAQVFAAMRAAVKNVAARGADTKTSAITFLEAAQVVSIKNRPADSDTAQIEFQFAGQRHHAQAKLLALADGGALAEQVVGVTRHEQDYRQWAVVAEIKTEHESEPESELRAARVAYERFTEWGPIAMLPTAAGYSLVWTLPTVLAQEILQLDDASFLARLQQQFGNRLGRLLYAGKRGGFPLALKYTEPAIAAHTAFIGNAAQTLHPVAGQGFNLGLRDAWELAEDLRQQPESLGSAAQLQRYQRKRRIDRSGGRWFTDGLVKIFSNDLPLVASGRGVALGLLDCLPPARRFVARRMMFGARG